MSPIYISHTKGFTVCVSTKSISTLSMIIHAYSGANLVKCGSFTKIIRWFIPKVPFTPHFSIELIKIPSQISLIYHISCRYNPKTFLQNTDFRLTKNLFTQVKNSARTKVTFFLSLLAGGAICSAVE